jgi:hypothetical protein
MRKIALVFIILSTFYSAQAQIGGNQGFAFLSLDPSARIASMGGNTIAINDKDLSLAYLNPSLLKPEMSNHAILGYGNYLADINHGFFSYARHYDSIGTFSASAMYINYGDFDETDETGAKIGTFSANDYNFQLGYGNAYKKFTYGANVKFMYSQYERYIATGAAVDLAGAWHQPEKKITATVLIKNMGYNLIPFRTVRVAVPFEIQAGISKKLEHNPLRISIVAHNLQKWDLSYVNTNRRNKEIDLETGEEKYPKIGFGDKLMRHIIIGGEMVFSDNFQLRFGYNYQRRKELSPENRRLVTGFSWGVGIGIKKFYFSYGSSSYFPGIAANYFSVSKNLDDFKKKTKFYKPLINPDF